jgi:hypothetical protein
VAGGQEKLELVRARVQELAAAVSTEWKELGSARSEVVVVKVHGSSPLEPDVGLVHPCILVSVIDVSRNPADRQGGGAGDEQARNGKGQGLGDYLAKEDFGIAVQQNEGCSVLVAPQAAGGDQGAKTLGAPLVYKAEPRGCRHILPVLTQPCPLLPLALAAANARERKGAAGGRGLEAGVAPVWEEEIAFEQSMGHMVREDVIYFFELVDFHVPSASALADDDDTSGPRARRDMSQHAWRRLAWGFYRPAREGASLDGSVAANALVRKGSAPRLLSKAFSWRGTRVAPGPANSFQLPGGLGARVSLQLYRYAPQRSLGLLRAEVRESSDLGAGCRALDSWHRFLKNPSAFPSYPATLDVTVSLRARPLSEPVPRLFGMHHPIVEPCRLRLEDGGPLGGGLAVTLSMTFREAMSSREVVWVQLAPRGGWQARRARGQQLQLADVVPVGAVLQARASSEEGGVLEVQLAAGFESGESLTLTLGIGDKAAKAAWQAVYGGGHRWMDVSADVVRSRPIAPWQFEREVPPRGELDSVSLLRATGSKAAKAAAGSSDPMEAGAAAGHGLVRFDSASPCWCRVPNVVKLSLPAHRHGCSCVSFSSCGRWLAAAMCSQPQVARRGRCPILIFEASSGLQVASLEGHDDLIYDIQWVQSAAKAPVSGWVALVRGS